MACSDIQPVKKTSIIGCDYIPCPDQEATHWLIEVGWDGGQGFLLLPTRRVAEICMKRLVIPYEVGEI